jgi:hypothetical protein
MTNVFYDVIMIDEKGNICDELDGNFSCIEDAKLSLELELRRMREYSDYEGCSVAIREFQFKIIDKKEF